MASRLTSPTVRPRASAENARGLPSPDTAPPSRRWPDSVPAASVARPAVDSLTRGPAGFGGTFPAASAKPDRVPARATGSRAAGVGSADSADNRASAGLAPAPRCRP